MEIELGYSQKEWDYYISGTLQGKKMSEQEHITVTVKFFATLRDYGPIKASINVKNGDTITSLLDRYDIPKDKRKIIVLIS